MAISSLMARLSLTVDALSSGRVCSAPQTSSIGKVLYSCCRDEEDCSSSTTRRIFGACISLLGFSSILPQAKAFGDQSLTIEDVTPAVASEGQLLPLEEKTIQLFEKNTYSVVNVFDTTLRPELNLTGSIEVPEGNGTGIIWDKEGHLVTNYHVVGSALSKGLGAGKAVARVSLLVGKGIQKTFQADLVGADKTKDIAVLKVNIPEEYLQPITLGESSNLKVGQRCLAIGNPFGFDHTLTVGVVSGLNRDITSKTGVIIGGGIQTDAAINPGNSGGPLLDSRGNLIGINTAIFTRTGTSAGVGFAIPVDAIRKVVPQLIKYGSIMHAGLKIQLAPDLVAKQLNVKNGALILSVPDSKYGLKPTSRGFGGNIILGDVIIGVNEKSVNNPSEVAKVFDEYEIGEEVVLKVKRGENEVVDVPVKLEQATL